MRERTKKSSFVKQAAILAAASIIVRILGFLYRVPLTNMIGDEGNGIYSAGYYIYTLFLVMSSSGLPAAISKMVSEKYALGHFKSAHKIFKVSLTVAGLTGLAGTLIMFFGAGLFCQIIKSPRSYYTILTLSPTIFIVAIMAVFRGYFQGMNTTVPTAISQIVEQIFHAVFSVLLAYLLMKGNKANVELGAAGGTAGTGIGALAGLVFIFFVYSLTKPKIRRKIKADNNKGREESNKEIAINLIKIAVPIITGTAIFSMTNLIDMQMVMSRLTYKGHFTTQQAEGLYGQLTGKYVTLTTLPVSISSAFATAVLPNIAGSVALNDKQAIKNKINTTLRITMIISIPAAIGLGVLGDQILLLLFPNASGGGILLKVGAISVIFLALSQIVTGILQGIGKVYTPAVNALIGALVKIPLNYFLIGTKSINVLGAVISTIVCYVIASVLNLVALIKSTDVVPDFKGILLKPMAASLVMALGCYVFYNAVFVFFNSNTIATIIAMVASLIIYFMFMILIKGFDRNDLKLVPMGSKFIKILDKFNMI